MKLLLEEFPDSELQGISQAYDMNKVTRDAFAHALGDSGRDLEEVDVIKHLEQYWMGIKQLRELLNDKTELNKLTHEMAQISKKEKRSKATRR